MQHGQSLPVFLVTWVLCLALGGEEGRKGGRVSEIVVCAIDLFWFSRTTKPNPKTLNQTQAAIAESTH